MITFLKYQVGKVSLVLTKKRLKSAEKKAARAKYETVFGLAVYSFNRETTCFNSNRVRFAGKRNKVEI